MLVASADPEESTATKLVQSSPAKLKEKLKARANREGFYKVSSGRK